MASIVERQPGLRNLWRAMPVLLFYTALGTFVLSHLSNRAWDVGRHFLLAIGVLQVWRLSTMFSHIFRATLYHFYTFPKMRRQVATLPRADRFPARLCVIIPTYHEKPEVSRRMLQSVLREALPLPCRLVLYVTTGGPDEDAVIFDELRRHHVASSRVEVVFMRQQGKRLGMGYALRALARSGDVDDTLVVLMDGDAVLGPSIFEKTLPLFRIRPNLGALTTDNLAETEGANWYGRWYDLRFSMRHRYMKSVSLSHRVLTLTGRFSIFRGPITVSDEFLRYLEADEREDWFYGRFPFLTGDDKSTWFAVLKNRWEMLYVPDAYIICLEDSSDHPVRQSFAKMFRWFGNMLRNNGRAIALGPRCTGWFTWWCLLDQRLSIWTTLIGPAIALLLSATSSGYYLVFYLVMASIRRVFYLAVLALEGHRVHIFDLPLLLFTDWSGALMKMTVLADLKNQRWAARESSAGARRRSPEEQQHFFIANYRRVVWWALFVLCLLIYAHF